MGDDGWDGRLHALSLPDLAEILRRHDLIGSPLGRNRGGEQDDGNGYRQTATHVGDDGWHVTSGSPGFYRYRSRTNDCGEARVTTNSESNSFSAIVTGSLTPTPVHNHRNVVAR